MFPVIRQLLSCYAIKRGKILKTATINLPKQYAYLHMVINKNGKSLAISIYNVSDARINILIG